MAEPPEMGSVFAEPQYAYGREAENAYLSAVENVVLRLEPRPYTSAMMATEMPAAIKPYTRWQ
jgi:hypothetical protein